MAELVPGDPIILTPQPALVPLTLGENSITKLMALYKHTDGKYYMASNDVSDAAAKAVVLCLSSGGLDQLSVGIATGYVNFGVALVAGTAYYLASTPGKIEPYADVAATERLVKIGDAVDTAIMFVNIKALSIVPAGTLAVK